MILPAFKLVSGKEIPNVGFGIYLMSKSDTVPCVELALQSGYRHIDSAQFYHNEAECAQGILNFLKKNPAVKREDIFYTTKIMPRSLSYESTTREIESSFAKVKGLGYIDLLLIHSPGSGKVERLAMYEAFQDAVVEGKVKDIGVSNYGIHHLQELLSWPKLKIKPSVNQIEINPWLQRTELTEFCKESGIVVEAYSPLMRGNRLDDPELAKMAKKYNKTVAQILVRWNLQKGFVPLPKTATESRIKSNVQVYDFELDAEDLESLGDKSAYYVPMPSWDPVTWP